MCLQYIRGCNYEKDIYIDGIYRAGVQRKCRLHCKRKNIHRVQARILSVRGHLPALSFVWRGVWDNRGQQYRRDNVMLFAGGHHWFRHHGQFYIYRKLLLQQLI